MRKSQRKKHCTSCSDMTELSCCGREDDVPILKLSYKAIIGLVVLPTRKTTVNKQYSGAAVFEYLKNK